MDASVRRGVSPPPPPPLPWKPFGSPSVELGPPPQHLHSKFDEDDFATAIDPGDGGGGGDSGDDDDDDGFGFADSERRPTFSNREFYNVPKAVAAFPAQAPSKRLPCHAGPGKPRWFRDVSSSV